MLDGRLNLPPTKPPLWDDDFEVSDGQVWQYLPINELTERLQLDLISMVVELAPDSHNAGGDNLKRRWQSIDDKWVATHHGYAFQWFAMALAFFIATLVLLLRSVKAKPNNV
jgi:cytochrome oxidase assembly protein ShyY1